MNRIRTLSAVVVASLGLAINPVGGQAQTRPFTAEDMLAVAHISGAIAVSPDGSLLAFVLPDLTDDWNVNARQQVGSVHLLRTDDGGIRQPEPIGRPGQRGSLPAFSPDGSRLALHLDGPAGGRLAVYDVTTQELTTVGTGYTGQAWQPPQWVDGTHIVYQRPSAPPPEPETPRVTVMESTDPTLPGDDFFRQDRRAGLAVVDLATRDEQAIVTDGSQLLSYSVSPKGGHAIVAIAGEVTRLLTVTPTISEVGTFAPAMRPAWLADGRVVWRRSGQLLANRVEELDAGVVLLDPIEPALTSMVWSPDAVSFASLVPDPTISDPEIEPPRQGMFTIARPFTDAYLVSTPGGSATNLTPDTSDNIRSLVWSSDARSLYFVATDNATYDETLYRYDVLSHELEVIGGGQESFGALVPIPGGLVASIQTATSPPDLWRIGDDGSRERLTELNPQLAEHAFSKPELFYFDNQEGDRLGALLYKPVGVESDVPVITYVYEKLTPNVHRFQPRHQLFVTHGYAVLMPNVKVEVGETATSFVRSVVPAVEDVHAMGFTNGRACMWGGSFGAFATSFVITQTNIFDCAVSRATPPELFRNWASGRDRDSNNIETGQARMGGSPFEVMDRYLSQSAFFHLDKVETPVLITHGVQDYTILHEEGAMMFYALRRLGKEATFVSYRDGDHSLYRHSRVDALDVHQRMLDWFEKYLRD